MARMRYLPRYCDEVIAAGARGLSLTAFAGEIGVCRNTLARWMRARPAFADACQVAQAKRALFLETSLLSAGVTAPMVTARRAALTHAAPHDWGERAGDPVLPRPITEIRRIIVRPPPREGDADPASR